MDLDSVATELYALPRDDFTATRDTRAKEARSAGQRDLAAAIGKLRKPTSAAWVANLLAREEPAAVRRLVELGTALREAHATLDGSTLQGLSRQRHQVVHAVVTQARSLGRAAGHPVSETVARELEETVTAALSDPDAAQALATGRLATALAPSAQWLSAAPATRPVLAAAPADSGSEDAATRRLREELVAARVAAHEAREAGQQAHHSLEAAQQRVAAAADAVRDLQERLAAARRDAEGAEQELRFARRAAQGADGEVMAAERRVRALEEKIGRR